jgi:hypothetical protein
VGDWFAVPLREGGFAVGVVARAQADGVLLGYFFGPKRDEVPELSELAHLEAAEAMLVCKFGHLGLVKKKWPVLGRVDGWDPKAWPMPTFVRYEELTGRSFRVFYADNDPNLVLREEQISAGSAEQGPKDGLLGAGAAEIALTSLLG